MPQLIFVKSDYDGDQKQVSWATKDVSDFADYAAYLAAMVNMESSVDAWCIGRNTRTEVSQTLTDNGPGSAVSPVAQGALRCIIEAEDSVTGIVYRFPYPMPDLSKANDGDGDKAWIKVGQGTNSLTIMNPDHADYATFVTRFEAVVLSPNGNTVNMLRGYIEE